MSRLTVTLTEFSEHQMPLLEKVWIELQQNSEQSFFTSWHWISTWLKYINFKTDLIKVLDGDEVVGLGLLCFKSNRKYGVTSRQAWLNRTGDGVKDQIWLEYNDVLCAKHRAWAVRAALADYFEHALHQCDELMVGVSNSELIEIPRASTLMQHTSWETVSYATHLQSAFANLDCFLNTLSANTRSQIRRTQKLYSQRGAIKLTKASSAEEALMMLNEVSILHLARWGKINSGFENPEFFRFHVQLIKDNFNSEAIDILKLTVGELTIGYLYNLIYQDQVYFYLSGINYEKDNRIKPGLLIHSLATAYYAEKGYSTYDYMGGEGRYKKSLSSHSNKMIISSIRRKKPHFLLSYCIHKLKSRFTNQKSISNCTND
ncbi:GNAT family N-acetyltransferase [Flavobacterium sp. W21_SRS_FM6]|uniref:GNAT family N-acetyltransferase n=1 Tax=Flavobacterium sp. W21_SRS_FM6 TaxID=3240268 RepID=UPI003F92720C